MKKLYLFTLSFLSLMIYSADVQAQATLEDSTRNLVKVNVTALPLRNFSFQYERPVSQKTSVALGIRFMPNGGAPLQSVIEGFFDEDDNVGDQVGNLKLSNFAITPEFRYYTGGEALRGFYVAPFLRYATYSASLPYEYEYEHPIDGTVENMIDLDGRIGTFTGGIMIGAQWKLSKLVYLDWWILGPQYGTASGKIDGRQNLSPEEQAALRDELAELEDLPLVDVTSEVNSEGAKIDFSGPWAGIRAGLAIGFRF